MEIPESEVSCRDGKYSLQEYKIISVWICFKCLRIAVMEMGWTNCFQVVMLHAVIQQKDMSYVEWKKKYLEHILARKYKPTAMKVRFNSDNLPHNNQSWGFSLFNFEVEKGVTLAF